MGRWTRIGIYYLVAIGISALARYYWHTDQATSVEAGAWAMYLHLVAGAGPALGAMLVWLLFRYRSRFSLGGTNLPLALVMVAVPAIVMAIRGIPNDFGIEPHLFGVHMGLWIMFYALLEEIGWRGYLQDELGGLSAPVKYSMVGLFWYAWHLSWLGGNPLSSELATLFFMILASAGIGFVADRTRSVLAATAFHILGNIMGLTTDFKRIIPDDHHRIMICIVCVVAWLVILRVWRIWDRRRQAVISA
ncbi:CPBP family intramembrane metalloprotease [Sphingobium sp. BYY-5]|uniref:CPBP family intramembrane glutamic endopeptidase n=1 Tax=Sphingobium sp. BYY-5 TaxID=2926400 RepID=UPI001FA8085E|nr:CPBP family intramembrane glutamic endopeptidase [Sphingobium sp. BYY-5]MCI4589294.1 CPBP family intramembrane metalloprotease [Sphingobium sp. BYY-5]